MSFFQTTESKAPTQIQLEHDTEALYQSQEHREELESSEIPKTRENTYPLS